MQSFRGEGKVWVVVASSALSMGVNFPDIWYIVNWGPARSLLDQHQEAGRAGRDGLPSHVLIIYHGQQLSHCEEDIKAMVKANGCLRVGGYKPVDECIQPPEPGHSCCSYSSSRCSCGQCELSKPLFEQLKQGEGGATRDFPLTRPVSNQDKLDLIHSLMEVKDSLIKSNSVFDDISCHGFSDQLVQVVVTNCHQSAGIPPPTWQPNYPAPHGTANMIQQWVQTFSQLPAYPQPPLPQSPLQQPSFSQSPMPCAGLQSP